MKKAAKITLLFLGIVLLLMITTQPANLPSPMLIVPFILLFMSLTMLLAMLLAWRRGSLTAKTVRAGALGAALPILLLVLQSVGQLTARDVLIIMVLFGLTYFYVSRMSVTAKAR